MSEFYFEQGEWADFRFDAGYIRADISLTQPQKHHVITTIFGTLDTTDQELLMNQLRELI